MSINKISNYIKKNVVYIFLGFISILCLILVIIFLGPEKSIYQIAVVIRDQVHEEKAEDKRSALKYGDILVIENAGHKWSKLEEVSFLILNIKLTQEQKELMLKSGEFARMYRVDMEKYFPDFNPNDVLQKQPFLDKVYSWKIIKNKQDE